MMHLKHLSCYKNRACLHAVPILWGQFTCTAKSVWFSWPRAGRCGCLPGILHSCMHDLWQWKLWRHWKINIIIYAIIIASKEWAKQSWFSMFYLQKRWLEVAGVERSRNFRWEPRPWQLKLFEAYCPWYCCWLFMDELVPIYIIIDSNS